jgi:hypothetical protein
VTEPNTCLHELYRVTDLSLVLSSCMDNALQAYSGALKLIPAFIVELPSNSSR